MTMGGWCGDTSAKMFELKESVMPSFEAFSPIPSLAATAMVTAAAAAPDATVLGVPVGTSGEPPSEAGSDRAALALAGFDATVGSVLIMPAAAGQVVVLVGIGDAAALSVAGWRDAAAAFASAARGQGSLALRLPEGTQVSVSYTHLDVYKRQALKMPTV